MALDLCTKCVSSKYLPNKWLHVEKILLVLLSKFEMHTKSQRSGGVSWLLKLLLSNGITGITSLFRTCSRVSDTGSMVLWLLLLLL